MPGEDSSDASSAPPSDGDVHIERTGTGVTVDDQEIEAYTLSHDCGLTARITNFGATLTGLDVPDQQGGTDDVVLGFDAPERYRDDHPFFGATIGRYANRIANGTFSLDGTSYTLPCNDGPHHLHGGPDGFQKQIWSATPSLTDDGAVLDLSYTSPDGEANYPGAVSVSVAYRLEASGLRIDYHARTDRTTIVNLTNHAYFNLAGHDAGDVLDHRVRIYADHYTPIDHTLIPTGEIAPVEGTPLDFTSPAPVGSRVNRSHPQIEYAGGCDHNFVLHEDTRSALSRAAEVHAPSTGRILTVKTTKPGVQFYSGNLLEGQFTGKEGAVYDQYSGFCLEPQYFPDSPNHPRFPSAVLAPGDDYEHTTVYAFSTSGDR